MTDARRLFEAYVRQRIETGEQSIILPGRVNLAGLASADDSTSSRREMVDGKTGEAVERPDHGATPPKRATRPAGAKWQHDLPTIPGPGIVIPGPSSDLFSSDPLANCGLDEVHERVHACRACALGERRTNAVPGEGPHDARLVVVGEGPGAREDELGRPFVGRAGELLTDILKAIDLPREQVFICNVVKCRPPSNRTPAQDEIEACTPYLHRQLAVVRPAVILAMGSTAAQTLLQTRQTLGAMRGKVHDYRGIPLIVTYHPAALLRNPNWKKPTWDDVRIARQLVDVG